MSANLCRLSEDEARDLLERIRWPEGAWCPHCKSDNVLRLGGKAGAEGRWKCRACRKKFTVRVGTIFEDSPLPLWQWVYAFASMCASKKGISALQLSRELDVQYKTAWHMCHRIRWAMAAGGMTKLEGTVEVDETYVGGKPRRHNKPTTDAAEDATAPPRPPGKRCTGRGTKKTPVLALVERRGRVRTRVIANVTAKTLKGAIREQVEQSATIMTDEWASYTGIGEEFDGGHRTVTHSAGEYANPDGTNTNTVESYFALIKRGVYGTFHHVSKQHLQRYCDEFGFRWDHRMVSDEERTFAAIRATEGRRLSYRPCSATPPA